MMDILYSGAIVAFAILIYALTIGCTKLGEAK